MKEICNSRDVDCISALYSEEVIFKSPRVRSIAGEASGVLRGRDAVRDYCRLILERRPDLTFAVERVFAGVDSIALEYRVGDIRGVEFMTLDGDGLICFTAGNDLA
jgi:ketosteroid isomerase-like protein